MKTFAQMYRKTYTGEEVVSELTYTNASWSIAKEWIPNAVFNNQISNQAVIIGNGISRKDFNLKILQNHHGGMLGASKLQLYGCNALYRDMTPDFLVVSGLADGIIKEVANSGYCDNNVVYADAMHVQEYPGKFYLIPQDPGWNSGSMATYLACFDGHTKIYLLGFDCQDTPQFNYNVYAGSNGYQPVTGAQVDSSFLELTMKKVFDTYNQVQFIRVMPTAHASIPESWKYCLNFSQIDFRGFAISADL
jgi:hypothetical protein